MSEQEYPKWKIEKEQPFLARCPKCNHSAPKHQYSGLPIFSNYCPDCGARLLRPSMAPYKMIMKSYGIHFRMDEEMIEDFFMLKNAWREKWLIIDCIQDQAISDIHALERCGWITDSEMKWFKQNFIYSDEGFKNKI